MAKVKKIPYYQMESSLFGGKKWKCYMGSEGCVAINTPQTISFERLAPGEKSPPKPPKPTKEQLKAQQAEEALKKALAQLQKKQQPKEPSKPEQPKSKILEAEDQEKLPEFDLQDIPSAMDKIGWPMSAKVARKWFSSPKHIWDNNLDSVQPLDDTTVTLNWALKYGSVKGRFNELLLEDIYSEKAFFVIKKKILQHVNKTFSDTTAAKPKLSFDTVIYSSDLRLFHTDWHFQRKEVSTFDTFEGRLMTDLSGTLGNFVLYAAIGRVEVSGERYFKYEKRPAEYCIDTVAQLTHVYIYLKDNYSFNDKDSSKSQYLGHWNKRDMILSYTLGANELLGSWKFKMNGGKIEQEKYNWDYLLKNIEVDKPIDKRTGLFKKFMEKDVYWPVYNKTYNEWREKHNRGGDFMIYSKPQLFKLKKPITIKLETICRPHDNTFIGQ